MVSTNVAQVGDQYLLSAKLVDTEAANVTRRWTKKLEADESALTAGIEEAVRALVPGTQSSAPAPVSGWAWVGGGVALAGAGAGVTLGYLPATSFATARSTRGSRPG